MRYLLSLAYMKEIYSSIRSLFLSLLPLFIVFGIIEKIIMKVHCHWNIFMSFGYAKYMRYDKEMNL